MRYISNSDEYDRIVNDLADNFNAEIDSRRAMEIANAVVSGYELMDNGEVAVYHCIHLYGEPRVIDGSDERLNPYDVLQFSEQSGRQPTRIIDYLGG